MNKTPYIITQSNIASQLKHARDCIPGLADCLQCYHDPKVMTDNDHFHSFQNTILFLDFIEVSMLLYAAEVNKFDLSTYYLYTCCCYATQFSRFYLIHTAKVKVVTRHAQYWVKHDSILLMTPVNFFDCSFLSIQGCTMLYGQETILE